MTEHATAGLRHRHPTPAAWTFEQLHVGDSLEDRDLLADRRLGVAEPASRGRERAGLDDRLQGGQMAKLDP